MISEVTNRTAVDHSWSQFGDYEHEVILSDGTLGDLKADFRVNHFTIDGRSLLFELIRPTDGVQVWLEWKGLHRVEVAGGPLNLTAEDDLGFMGARLLAPLPEDSLAFQIDTDDLEVRCLCDSFAVRSRFPS